MRKPPNWGRAGFISNINLDCQDFLAAADSRRESNGDAYRKVMHNCPKSGQITITYREESARNQGYRYNPSGVPLLEEQVHHCSMLDIDRPSGPRVFYQLSSRATNLILQADLLKGTEVTKAAKEQMLGNTFMLPRVSALLAEWNDITHPYHPSVHGCLSVPVHLSICPSVHPSVHLSIFMFVCNQETGLRSTDMVRLLHHELHGKVGVELAAHFGADSVTLAGVGSGEVLIYLLQAGQKVSGFARNEPQKQFVEKRVLDFIRSESVMNAESEFFLSRETCIQKTGVEPDQEEPSVPAPAARPALAQVAPAVDLGLDGFLAEPEEPGEAEAEDDTFPIVDVELGPPGAAAPAPAAGPPKVGRKTRGRATKAKSVTDDPLTSSIGLTDLALFGTDLQQPEAGVGAAVEGMAEAPAPKKKRKKVQLQLQLLPGAPAPAPAAAAETATS